MIELIPHHFQWILEVFVLDVSSKPRPTHRDDELCSNFCDSVSDRVLPKIYVAVDGKEIRYVGLSTTSITTRLSRGYASMKKPRNGYSGYKWLDPPKNGSALKLYVFSFSNLLERVPIFESGEQSPKELMHLLERIEAELVHLVRVHSERWPTCQNEIHFRNLDGDLAIFTQQAAQQLWAAL